MIELGGMLEIDPIPTSDGLELLKRIITKLELSAPEGFAIKFREREPGRLALAVIGETFADTAKLLKETLEQFEKELAPYEVKIHFTRYSTKKVQKPKRLHDARFYLFKDASKLPRPKGYPGPGLNKNPHSLGFDEATFMPAAITPKIYRSGRGDESDDPVGGGATNQRKSTGLPMKYDIDESLFT